MNKKGFTLIEIIICMAIVGILLAILIPYTCGDKKYSTTEQNENIRQEEIVNGYSVVTIDGCQYIKTNHTLVHKANCNNYTHKKERQNNE
jgi:prepilin-type N-terminal cleavage/methylation domain-containing protein